MGLSHYTVACSVVLFYTVLHGWTHGYIPVELSGMSVEYIYYTDKITWNEARTVCHHIGGELAKIDSQFILDKIVQLSIDKYPGENLLHDDFWVGLSEPAPGRREWAIDCALLNFTSNFLEPYHDKELCFKISPSDDFAGISRQCDENSPFLCERHTDETCSSFTYMLREVGSDRVPATDYSSCEASCTSDNECGGFVFLSQFAQCYTLAKGDNLTVGIHQTTYATKFCANFVKNETVLTPWENHSKFPTDNCSINTGVLPTSVLPSSTSLTPSFTVSTTVPLTSNVVSPSTAWTAPAVCSTLVLTELVSTPCQCLISTVAVTQTQTQTQTQTATATLMTTVLEFQDCSTPTPVPHVTPVITSSCPLPSISIAPVLNLTQQEASEMAEEIRKNLTVDAKKTSAYLRTLISAPDQRKTSQAIGTVGIVCIAIPLALIMSTDVQRIFALMKPTKQ